MSGAKRGHATGEIAQHRITGALLAGGQGRRMGGADKGLLHLNGKPFAAWVLAALRPQTGALLLSANRSLSDYRALGVPVITDRHPGYLGPLAGLHALLRAATTEYVLTAPCDTPCLPLDLAQRLGRALCRADADIATVTVHGREQPLHALLRTELVEDLDKALVNGVRKPADWYRQHHWVSVPCDDVAASFTNLNTPAQRMALEQALCKAGPPES